jgi:hypothetical protein
MREHDRIDPLDPVETVLEVLGPGPALEGGRQLSVVAGCRKTVT